MKTIEITKQDLNDLTSIKLYFVEHDKTIFEHAAFSIIDRLIKKVVPIENRNYDIDLLELYTKFLQKNGYIDSDATTEQPYAIDEFLKTKKYEKQ